MGDPLPRTPAQPRTPNADAAPHIRTVDGTTIRVRPLTSVADGHACVELQRLIWGFDQGDIVPATLLHIVEYVGGLAAGAFDQDGTLLGFVFGISGVRDGRLAHWSHMLGVREPARNMGVGRMLKEYQRSVLASLGVTRIYWSFDPLMAKNAYFNVNRLGAKVVDYVPDMYGTTDSPLHYSLPTDRLVVCLETTGPAAAPLNLPVHDRAPILTAFPRLSDATMSNGDLPPDAVLIEIPSDILEIMSRSPAAARAWRLAVREHFLWAFSHGYAISGVQVDADAARYFFLLTLQPAGATDVPTTSPIRAIHASPA